MTRTLTRLEEALLERLARREDVPTMAQLSVELGVSKTVARRRIIGLAGLGYMEKFQEGALLRWRVSLLGYGRVWRKEIEEGALEAAEAGLGLAAEKAVCDVVPHRLRTVAEGWYRAALAARKELK